MKRLPVLKLLMLVLVLVSMSAEARSLKQILFSPGQLTMAHQKFDDACEKCHSEFSKAEQSALCRDCHEQIDQDLSHRLGFHGLNPEVRKTECRSCHSEHKGRDYDVVGLDTESFDHHLTNFPLKNKHAELTCERCHSSTQSYRQKSWQCIDCHKATDPHRGNLGESCADCHNSQTWTQTTFDHRNTAFKLTFKHTMVYCKACHANEVYKNTPQQCVACHGVEDVHHGRFKDSCGECHSTRGWKKTDFDHNRDTPFKLVGKHLALACNHCHVRPAGVQKLPESCVGCHQKNDVHNERLGRDCQTCHTSRDWADVHFVHDQHTSFPLLGAHKHLTCYACHIASSARSDELKIEPAAQCIDCHALTDPHDKSLGRNCQQCHVETDWSQVRFSHELTRFPLLGMHRQASCDECHLSANYSKTDNRCEHCHQADNPHDPSLGDQCQQCHNPNDWGMWMFDHNRQTSYPLEGSHQDLQCQLCHAMSLNPSTRCEDCHRDDDVHQGAFGQHCQYCHTVDHFNR